MSKIQRPKGTQDITPRDATLWETLQTTAIKQLQQAHYKAMLTPIFESTSLFARGVGESTDIVNKEMYTFEMNKRSLTLRPEGTAGVVRAFIENNFQREPMPQRFYYVGPMFRYERPQEGRQRQFHQLGAELFGLDTPAADAEIILLAWQILQALGIQDVRLELNTVGDPADRVAFREQFKAFLKPRLSELCEDCQRRYEQNPIRMLDCKVPTCKAIYEGKDVADFLATFEWSEPVTKSFTELQAILTAQGIPFTVNPKMVRGLDYYTRTVFEFVTDRLGAQGTVCGGGRYNHLVEELGGQACPAIGWAMGLERLSKLMPDMPASTLDAYIVTDQPAAAFTLASHLRAQGLVVEVDLGTKSFNKQLAQANKRGAKQVYTLGADEVASGNIPMKDFETGEQSTLTLNVEPANESSVSC